jgi:hypothetical protein
MIGTTRAVLTRNNEGIISRDGFSRQAIIPDGARASAASLKFSCGWRDGHWFRP